MRLAPVLVLAVSLSFVGLSGAAHAKKAAKIDANGDGKISLEQFLAARGRTFERIDTDHDGQLSAQEIEAYSGRLEAAEAGAMIRHGKERRGAGERQIERLAKLAETGPVTRARWDQLMTRRFQKLDTAGVGFITRDQLHAGGGKAKAAPQPSR